MTQPSSVPGPPALAGHRSAALHSGLRELACCSPARHVVFSAGRQQWSPQVHFKGIVVKMPSKLRRSFECLPPRCCALSAARSELISTRPCSRVVKAQWKEPPTQSNSVKTAGVDLKRLPSFPRRASGTYFSAMTITLLISWLVGSRVRNPTARWEPSSSLTGSQRTVDKTCTVGPCSRNRMICGL